MKKWKDKAEAPKDGTQIIGCFGANCKQVIPCIWNDVEQLWITSVVQANLFHGKWNDYYFENMSEKDGNMIGWMPIPEFES